MKKITLIVLGIVLGISACAQRSLPLSRGMLTLMKIEQEKQRLYGMRNAAGRSYIDVHPIIEFIAVNTSKIIANGSWGLVTGNITQFGDSTFLTDGDSLRLFSDVINSGDSRVFTNPDGLYNAFSVLKHDAYLMINRQPWPGQKGLRYDTIQIFTGPNGNYPGEYKFTFYFDLRNPATPHFKSWKLRDNYLHTERTFDLSDTLDYPFTFNASDPANADTGSRMKNRFQIIVERYTPPVVFPIISGIPPQEGSSFRIAPNPAMHGNPFRVVCEESYDRAECILYDMYKRVVVRKSFSGNICGLMAPAQPGTYIISIQDERKRVIQKKMQVL